MAKIEQRYEESCNIKLHWINLTRRCHKVEQRRTSTSLIFYQPNDETLNEKQYRRKFLSKKICNFREKYDLKTIPYYFLSKTRLYKWTKLIENYTCSHVEGKYRKIVNRPLLVIFVARIKTKAPDKPDHLTLNKLKQTLTLTVLPRHFRCSDGQPSLFPLSKNSVK